MNLPVERHIIMVPITVAVVSGGNIRCFRKVNYLSEASVFASGDSRD